MAITDLFSKRQRRLRGEMPDVYRYDNLPKALRVQIVQITGDAIGTDKYGSSKADDAYRSLHDTLAREYGVFRLTRDSTDKSALRNFFLATEDVEQALDVVELSFRFIDRAARDSGYLHGTIRKVKPDDAISELNERLREHGIGFQYESGELVRVDSQLVHAEVVKPALQLLRNLDYEGANEEFLNAHEHYRHGRFEEAITECLKSLESTLKAICHKRRWTCAETDTAKRLLDVVFTQGLIPSYLQSEFSALRTSLESGVPTVRNKQAGHGQGTQVRRVPQHLVSYLLHLTATSILFLVESEKALP